MKGLIIKPTFLFPEYANREWILIPWVEKPETTIVICPCRLREVEVTGQEDCKSVRVAFFNSKDCPKEIIVGLGECEYCKAMIWCCNNLYELIKWSEQNYAIDRVS